MAPDIEAKDGKAKPAPDTEQPLLDPAIQAAADPASSARPEDRAEIDPLQKARDALLASDPSHPQHSLYQQALKGLGLLDQKNFKDRKELERVALAIAMQAGAIGLTRVDRVALSQDPAGYFFVDQHAVDPALRGYVSHAQAVQPGAEMRLAQEAQRVREQQTGQEQVQQTEQVQRDLQQRREQVNDNRNQVRDDNQTRESQQRSQRQDRQSQDRSQARQDQARQDQSRDEQARRDQAARDAPAKRIAPPSR